MSWLSDEELKRLAEEQRDDAKKVARSRMQALIILVIWGLLFLFVAVIDQKQQSDESLKWNEQPLY